MKRFLSVAILSLMAASFSACTKKEEAPAPTIEQAVQAPAAAPGTEQAPAAPAPEQPGS